MRTRDDLMDALFEALGAASEAELTNLVKAARAFKKANPSGVATVKAFLNCIEEAREVYLDGEVETGE